MCACVCERDTILLGLDDRLFTFFAPLRVREDHFQADVGVGRKVRYHMARCFRVHLQAVAVIAACLLSTVAMAVVAPGDVVETNGDVEGVTPCDVVAQRLPVHRDGARSGLCDLQRLWSAHGLYETHTPAHTRTHKHAHTHISLYHFNQ